MAVRYCSFVVPVHVLLESVPFVLRAVPPMPWGWACSVRPLSMFSMFIPLHTRFLNLRAVFGIPVMLVENKSATADWC